MNGLEAALSSPLESLAEGTLDPVIVAVIDSGVDATHPALRHRVSAAFATTTDQDHRWTLQPCALPACNDRFGHGTSVAGLIAATAPNASLIDIGVLDEKNLGAGEALLEALRYAIESEAKLINMSLAAKAKFAPDLNRLCEAAYRAGKIVVAAKRNQTLFDFGFPAEFSSCVSVDIAVAGGFLGLKYLGSTPIEFAAQGVDLVAPAPGDLYTRVTGTSFATPIVSGICALLLGRYPHLTVFEIKALLKHFSGGEAP